MTELAQVRSMLEATLKGIDELKAIIAPKRKPLSRQAFADATGYHVQTIYRMIRAGEIQIEKGRIPASELDRFLS